MRIWKSLCTLTLLSLGACGPEMGEESNKALETGATETFLHTKEPVAGLDAAAPKDADSPSPQYFGMVANSGSYWNFNNNTSAPWPDNGGDLTSVPRYANGPCAGRAPWTCQFDTRVIAVVNGQLVESITAYGRYWNFDMNNNYAPLPDNGTDLTLVPRYANGPCAGRPQGTCRFATRSIADLGSGPVESISIGAY